MPGTLMLFFLVFCAAFALTWSMDACARSRGVLFERGVTLVGGVAVASALVLVFMCGRFFFESRVRPDRGDRVLVTGGVDIRSLG